MARSILAERLAAHLGAGRIAAFSAGSFPKGAVHPLALAALDEEDVPRGGVRSKSWDEFAAPGAPAMDIVLTVCDAAAGETCPIWPGRPATAHWGIPDPAAAEGTGAERMDAFRAARAAMRRRIEALLALPFETMDPKTLAVRLKGIGRIDGDPA